MIGLVISVIFFALSVMLTHTSPSFLRSAASRAAIGYAGVLQLTWILGNEPHLRRVHEPSSQTLREAGMFEVKMSERMQNKMYEAVEREDETDRDGNEEPGGA